MASLIERDLTGKADLNEVLNAVSDLADFILQTHLQALHADLVGLYGEPIGEESGRPQSLMVIGMGKLGGRELNVSSDVDLIFAYAEDGETHAAAGQKQLSNHEFFVRLGKRLIADVSDVTEDGFSFRVDMMLRPHGRSGPLSASLGMLEQYLMQDGREWERYAWVKARAITGNAEDVKALESVVQPFVFRRYLDFGAIHALRDMHGQIRAEVARQEAKRQGRGYNVKLGRGGIREVEFLAQVFQLIRGGRDPELRDRSTRRTLDVLATRQLLAPDVVQAMQHAYAFLRNLEHRIQYLDDAQTHSLPASEEDLLVIARMMGFETCEALLNALEAQQRLVAEQFDEMFSEKTQDGEKTPNAPSDLLTEELDVPTLAEQLRPLGYVDPARMAERIQASLQSPRLSALPATSRARLLSLCNRALPIAVRTGGHPDDTFLRLLDFLEAVARRAAYLALLTEYPQALTRLLRMMGASEWAAKYLNRHPLLLDELLDDQSLLAPPDWPAFADECRRRLEECGDDVERQMDALRELHQGQLIRLLAQDLEGSLTVERLADHLSALADVLVEATMRAVWRTIANRHREVPRFAVIAYGKLGGKELGYASDLDVIFLYDDDDQEAPALYAKLAQRFITWMTTHTQAGVLFDVDVALRPDGASGLLVTSLAAFEKYQRQSAWTWEHQALTRARFCAGDAAIGEGFEAIRRRLLCTPRDAARLREDVLKMRERMREAHPNRSGQFDLKHDAGGMIDVEFMVQYLVLLHAHDHPALADDLGNIALLRMAGEFGLIDAQTGIRVGDAYRTFRRLQHRMRLQGAERARVEADAVAKERTCVTELWTSLFRTN